MRFQSEALGFQRKSSTPGERIVERRQAIWIEEFLCAWVTCVVFAGSPPASQDFLPSALQDFLVCRVLPGHELLD